ncbi:MAG: class I SAM-dependent methyltransferase [Thiovulaceae bacterium]|nr:class I SAM-dependent methyltransferase [Sulfurimonadaceae bacterium]
MKDNFEHKAKEWDSKSIRVQNALTIAEAIKSRVKLTPDMHLMDFGVGTGLLGFEVLKDVKSMVGVDTSKGMLEKLQDKNSDTLQIKPICQDIIENPLRDKFDGIISSMTLHHIESLTKFFTTIKNHLNNNGFIAIADLESEDGTFHSDNTGVFHFGFDKDELCKIVKDCGFKDVEFNNISIIKKPQRDFGIFLLTARV